MIMLVPFVQTVTEKPTSDEENQRKRQSTQRLPASRSMLGRFAPGMDRPTGSVGDFASQQKTGPLVYYTVDAGVCLGGARLARPSTVSLAVGGILSPMVRFAEGKMPSAAGETPTLPGTNRSVDGFFT